MKAEEELWKDFSLLRRLEESNSYGYVTCITCGAYIHYTDAQCGHLIPRGIKSVKYDPRNNNPQCMKCNMIYGGRPEEYERRLRIKIGDDEVNDLFAKSKKIIKWGNLERKELHKLVKSKIKQINRRNHNG